MLSHLRQHSISYLALFVALSGTSYAAINLPANSVGTPQLRDGAVTSSKIRDRTLLARDFSAGALREAVRGIRSGPEGPNGPTGATGPTGVAGPPGPAKVVVRTATGAAGGDDAFFATAVCQPGEKVVGGGTQLQGAENRSDHLLLSRPGVATGAGGFGISSSIPVTGDSPNAWTGEIYSAVAGRTLVVFALCAPI